MPLRIGGESPRFSGNKTITGSLTIGPAGDVVLVRDAANVLALKNGANIQTLRIYGTDDGAGNNEYMYLTKGGDNTFTIFTAKTGTGTVRTLSLGAGTGGEIWFYPNNGSVVYKIDATAFFPGADNARNIGTAGLRFQDGFFGRNLHLLATAPGTSGVGVLVLGNGTVPSTSPVDTVQLFSADISAGNASLGLRTETAVAVDAVLASTHTLSVTINGTVYKVLLST